jgi:hypothetical protein
MRNHLNERLQTRFNCCGIYSASDWRTIFLFGGQYQPVNYVDQWSVNNNLPYIDNVPDSCCVNPSYNCGKRANSFNMPPNTFNSFNSYNSFNDFANNRNNLIYSKGCQQAYIVQFSRDMSFLGILCIVLSGIALTAGSLLVFAYYMANFKR